MMSAPLQPGYPQGQGVYTAAQPPWSPGQPLPQQTASQSYNQVSRGVASDRLPPQPDLMRRPSTPMLAQQRPTNQASVRPALPVDHSISTAWKPIRIPTPGELGISVETPAKPAHGSAVLIPAAQKPNRLAGPDRFDLASVATWLDQMGAKKCQRERLSEGIQIQCSFAQGASSQERIFSIHGATDEAALRELVNEVKQWKEEAASSR